MESRILTVELTIVMLDMEYAETIMNMAVSVTLTEVFCGFPLMLEHYLPTIIGRGRSE
jgi:hypothetical protein